MIVVERGKIRGHSVRKTEEKNDPKKTKLRHISGKRGVTKTKMNHKNETLYYRGYWLEANPGGGGRRHAGGGGGGKAHVMASLTVRWPGVSVGGRSVISTGAVADAHSRFFLFREKCLKRAFSVLLIATLGGGWWGA